MHCAIVCAISRDMKGKYLNFRLQTKVKFKKKIDYIPNFPLPPVDLYMIFDKSSSKNQV